MTIHEFINLEIERWSEDAVFALMDQGFRAVLTDRGWRWVLQPLTAGVEPATMGHAAGLPVSRGT